ncbi:hypothetical protein DAI22_03g209000 [Oryza sativa Japonica Group]|nr:hypothetical protein DAI22_03g209000 [Oryza sativa Japonica Group]
MLCTPLSSAFAACSAAAGHEPSLGWARGRLELAAAPFRELPCTIKRTNDLGRALGTRGRTEPSIDARGSVEPGRAVAALRASPTPYVRAASLADALTSSFPDPPLPSSSPPLDVASLPCARGLATAPRRPPPPEPRHRPRGDLPPPLLRAASLLCPTQRRYATVADRPPRARPPATTSPLHPRRHRAPPLPDRQPPLHSPTAGLPSIPTAALGRRQRLSPSLSCA